jgi:hypothetical protein
LREQRDDIGAKAVDMDMQLVLAAPARVDGEADILARQAAPGLSSTKRRAAQAACQ